jgi:hypothetical protein
MRSLRGTNNNFERLDLFGLISGSLEDYEHCLSQSHAKVEKTASLDSVHVLGNEDLNKCFIEVVKYNLLSGAGRERLEKQLKAELTEWASKKRRKGHIDVKKDYGALLCGTILIGYLKVLQGLYATSPDTVLSHAQNTGILGLEDMNLFNKTTEFLRYVRNWHHLRHGNIKTYVTAGPPDVIVEYSDIAHCMGLKPTTLRNKLYQAIRDRAKIIDKVLDAG